MNPPYVLSIQSEVVYGHVGQGAARFALQRQGFEVLALPTVLLSNHPGHGRPTGETIDSARLNALLTGIAAQGLLRQTQAVLSGYMGEAEHTQIVLEAVRRVKHENPQAIYVCDPVFGDEDGAYARPGVAEAIARDLVPIADIVTPNRFELSSLTARQVHHPKSAHAAGLTLARPECLLTSVPNGANDIGAIALLGERAWMAGGARFDNVPNGTGDLLTALYLGWRLKTCSPDVALARSVRAVHRLARIASTEKMRELPLIAWQDELISDDAPTAAEIVGAS